MVIPEAGYLYGFHYPKYSGKGKEAAQIVYNINLASAKAIRAFRFPLFAVCLFGCSHPLRVIVVHAEEIHSVVPDQVQFFLCPGRKDTIFFQNFHHILREFTLDRSENGMGVEGEEKYRKADGSIEDDYRIDFYKEHLEQLHTAMPARM